MVPDLRVGYFLEDSAQEKFITGLVRNIASSRLSGRFQIENDMRSATGGRPRVLSELKRYLRDIQQPIIAIPDILVVALDTNCQGHQQIKAAIDFIAEKAHYQGFVVPALPNPHIERWYLADARAFACVISSSRIPHMPPYKCEKDRYKREILNAFRDLGIKPLFGGAEYGEDVALAIDLRRASRNDSSIKRFIDDFCRAATNFLS